jgi:predicted O-methyltransferase YrrM
MAKIIFFIKRYIYGLVSCMHLFSVGFFSQDNDSLIEKFCNKFSNNSENINNKYIFALRSALYLFSVGLFNSSHRQFITDICNHYKYEKKAEKGIIPISKYKDVFGNTLDIKVSEPLSANGNVSLLEVASIVKFVKQYEPDTIFEIGTFDGRTTLNMAVASGHDAHIYTLDLPQKEIENTKLKIEGSEKTFIEKEYSGARFLNTEHAEKITQIFGDSAVFNFKSFKNTVDLIFIDGSHSYDYVINDTEKCYELLKDQKGIIIWHDYDVWPGVTKALDEFYRNDQRFKNMRHLEGTTLVYQIFN